MSPLLILFILQALACITYANGSSQIGHVANCSQGMQQCSSIFSPYIGDEITIMNLFSAGNIGKKDLSRMCQSNILATCQKSRVAKDDMESFAGFIREMCEEETEVRKNFLNSTQCYQRIKPDVEPCETEYYEKLSQMNVVEIPSKTYCCSQTEMMICMQKMTEQKCGSIAASLLQIIWRLMNQVKVNGQDCEIKSDDWKCDPIDVSKSTTMTPSNSSNMVANGSIPSTSFLLMLISISLTFCVN